MKRKIFGAVLVMVLAIMPITAVQATEMKEPTVEAEEIIGVSATDVVVSENTKLTQDKVVTGDLYVKAPLDLNGFNLQVKGDVYAEADVFVDSGEKLTVAGSYMQKARYLEVNEGTVTIGGDLAVCDTDETGKRVMGTGCVRLFTTDSAVTIDGDMILNTDCLNGMTYGGYTKGIFTLKGDLIQEHAGTGFKPQNLILAGTEEQTLTLLPESFLGNLQVKNNINILVTDWFNAGLSSDVSVVTTTEEWSVHTNQLIFNGKELDVNGNFLAEGDVKVGSGTLKVKGSYWQMAGGLLITDGHVNVSKDLLIQNVDENGKPITGEGYLEIKDQNGFLKVGGSMLLNTTSNMYHYVNGKILIRKDLIQEPAEARFRPAYIYMEGAGAQKISFASANAQIGTLELGQHISKYTFNPNPCWNTLIEVENPFSDVNVKGWEFPYVKYALDYNLMGGKGTDNDGKVMFDPGKNMTRAEFVQALYNKEGKPAVTYSNVFTDVPDGKWFTNAIMWAYQNDIVKGKADKFDVSGNITREEMATILYKYAANYKKYEVAVGASLDEYTDASTISSWATKNIEWAIWCGVMKGKGTMIAPRDFATRAECATMLRNFIMAYED